MADEKIKNALILYLSQQGYDESSSTLKNEQKSLKRAKFALDIDSLQNQYRTLANWVFSSLDRFKTEYKPVLWICFVQVYIIIIADGSNTNAKLFFDTHKHIFISSFSSELNKVATVTDKRKLNNIKRSKSKVNVLKNLLFLKLNIKLSNLGFDLLLSFVFENGLTQILLILNEKCQISFSKTHLTTTVSKIDELHHQIINKNANIKKFSERRGSLPRIAWGIPYELEMVYLNSSLSRDLIRLKKQNVYPGLFRTSSIANKIRNAKQNTTVSDENVYACSHYVNIYAPKSESEFFTPIHTYLTSRLRVKEDNILSNKLVEDGVTNMGDSPWPSISITTLLDSSNEVLTAESSYDGSVVCSGDSKGLITLFETSKVPNENKYRSYREELIGHCDPVYSVSLARDKRKLLSASADGSVRLWMKLDTEFEENLESLQNSESSMHASNISSSKTSSKRWSNVQSFRTRILSSLLPIWSVSFCPLGHYFATTNRDCVRLYSIDDEREFAALDGHDSDVFCAKFHPNMHYLLTGSEDASVKLWDLRTHKPVRSMDGHLQGVHSVSMDASGKYLISCGYDNLCMIWDIASAKHLKAFYSGSLSETESDHTLVDACCSPTGEYLSFGSSDGRISVVDTKTVWGLHATSDFKLAETGLSVITKDNFDTLQTSYMRQFRVKGKLQSLKFLNEKLLFGICSNSS